MVYVLSRAGEPIRVMAFLGVVTKGFRQSKKLAHRLVQKGDYVLGFPKEFGYRELMILPPERIAPKPVTSV